MDAIAELDPPVGPVDLKDLVGRTRGREVVDAAETILIRSAPVSATKRYRWGSAPVVVIVFELPCEPFLGSAIPGIP